MIIRNLLIGTTAILLTGCQGNAEPGTVTADTAETFTEIGAEDTLNFTGTEPFWGGEVTGDQLRFDTPEDPDGQAIAVKRFAGLNGVSFSGQYNDSAFDLAATPGDCSDGMSDRTYPYVVIVRIGDSTLQGCGWTDAKPFTGDPSP